MTDGHECIIPKGLFSGALWQCDHCKRFWYRSTMSSIGWIEFNRTQVERYLFKLTEIENSSPDIFS